MMPVEIIPLPRLIRKVSLTIAIYAILAIYASHHLHAQSGPYMFSGTVHLGNGQIGLLAEDAEATLVLPALLADRDHGGWSAGVAKRTGLDDLTEVSGAFHLRLPWKDQIGIGLQHAGIDGYTEQRLTLSYARKLFDKLNAGVQFDLNRNTAEEYDDLISMTWAISIHAPLMKQLSMSAYIYNPLGTEDGLDLPAMVRIGALYAPSDKVGIAIEAEKDWRHDMRFKVGFNYHLHQRIALRWGVGTAPSLVHAGISWNILNNMALSGGWRYHSRLGSSLAASVSQYRHR